MAFTQADLDALKAIAKTGTRHVRFSDGREVTYRSMAELQAAIAMVAAEVGAAQGTPRVRRRRFATDKGL